MATYSAIKDPDAVLDYGIDWSDWLDTDTIATSTWSISGGESPADLTINSTDNTDTTTTVWLSGGTPKRNYTLTNHITTASSPARQDDRSIAIKVRQK